MIKPHSKLYAKSNFLISTLRKKLNVRPEIYFRWDIEGAFNGSHLIGSESNYQIFCYDKVTGKQYISENTLSLSELYIDIYDPKDNLDYYDIEGFLKEQESYFDLNYLISNADMMDQVSRVFGSTLVKIEDLNEIEDIFYRAFSQTELHYYDSYITDSSLDSDYARLDFLFEFASPGKEDELEEAMEHLFQSPQSGLLGDGCLCINHKGQQFVHEGLQWCHLIGRHF